MTQCVGPEFDVLPDGNLVARLAGSPADAALPSTGNGLRVDPAKGLWAPAEHRALSIGGSREDMPGGAIVHPGGERHSGVLSVTATNPSADRSMLCLLTFRAVLELKIAEATDDNAGYTGWSLLFGFDIDASGASPVATTGVIARRDHGVDHEATLIHQASDTAHVVLAPSAEAVIRVRCGLRVFDFGYGKYIRSYVAVRGIGVTL